MNHKIVHCKTHEEAEAELNRADMEGQALVQISHVSVGTIKEPMVHTILTFRANSGVLEGSK